MTLPYPNSPDMGENIATSISRIEQNLEYLDGILVTSSFKLIYKAYDMSTTTGAVNITGVGFEPSAAIIFASETTGDSISFGVCDPDSASMCTYKDYSGAAGASDTNCLYLLQSAGNSQAAVFTSWDSDGMTLTFTETGSCAAISMKLVILFMV
jgi:hypothetical protein